MKLAQRKSKWEIIDSEEETNESPSAALESLLEAEYIDKVGEEKDKDGYSLLCCHIYNIDDTNESELTYTSGIINSCLNNSKQSPIRFRHTLYA
jgi:hypothetical protein